MKKLLAFAVLALAPLAAYATPQIDAGVNGSQQGCVQLESATSGGSVSICAPAVSSAQTFNPPVTSLQFNVGTGTGTDQQVLTAGSNVTITQNNGAHTVTIAASGSSFVPRGFIAGLITSNDGTNPTTTIDVSAGQATDSTNAVVLALASQCQVVLTTNGAGGLDTGTVAASKWYGIFIINGTSGTSCIATLEAAGSAPSPTLPAGYTTYDRYIGSIATDASAHPVLYTQVGRRFTKAAPSLDQNVACSATGTLYTFQIPLGVVTVPWVRGVNTGASANPWWLSSPLETDQSVPGIAAFATAPGYSSAGATNFPLIENYLLDNTSGQLRLRCSSTGTNVTLYSDGWTDEAGMYQ